MSSGATEKSTTSVFYGEEDERSDTGYGLTAVVSDDLGNKILFWPEGYYDSDYQDRMDFDRESPYRPRKRTRSPRISLWGEDNEAFFFPYYGEGEAEEGEETETTDEDEFDTGARLRTDVEGTRRSMFVHTSPTIFHDVNNARKSVFGSIFLRTTGQYEETVLLKTVAESNYSMLQSLISSLDKIISETSDADRKTLSVALKDSVMKMLETHGIVRTYSDGSIHWDIYPIAQSYLFSVQIGDNLHQTRNLSRVEDRIVMGPVETLKLPYAWPAGSVWSGHWDSLGMAGPGSYVMPHGVSYGGKMRDGMFHDCDATLTYPSKFKALHCVYEKGKLLTCQFQFPDMLNHESENWGYCQFPDRRFWSEVKNGLKPAKLAQKTQIDPPRKIPPNCYDTNNGVYDPKTLVLSTASGEKLRVPLCEEELWIKKYCRKGFFRPTDFRPDLYPNWFSEEVIEAVLEGQKQFRAGKITYDGLQQIYANLGLLGPHSKFKKIRTPSEIAMMEFLASIPEPKMLSKTYKRERRFEGHKISDVSLLRSEHAFPDKFPSPTKISKSTIKFNEEYAKARAAASAMLTRGSRISFRVAEENETAPSLHRESKEAPAVRLKKKIPDYIFTPVQILKPPFPDYRRPRPSPKQCRSPEISEYSYGDSMVGEDSKFFSDFVSKKSLEEFMKRIIMERVQGLLMKERERDRNRLLWASTLPPRRIPKTIPNQECLDVLSEGAERLASDKEEFCDSDAKKTWDLKGLEDDRFNMIKYWGGRTYVLDIGVEPHRRRSSRSSAVEDPR